jgi:hypothetical protein
VRIEIQRCQSGTPARRIGLSEQHIMTEPDQSPNGIGLRFQHSLIEIQH